MKAVIVTTDYVQPVFCEISILNRRNTFVWQYTQNKVTKIINTGKLLYYKNVIMKVSVNLRKDLQVMNESLRSHGRCSALSSVIQRASSHVSG